MAASACISSIVTPSSSSISLSSLHSHLFHCFTLLPFKPTKPLIKSFTLKPHNSTHSHPFSLPLHLCHSSSSSARGDVESEFSNELDADQVEGDSEESEKVGNSIDDGRLYVGNLPYSKTSSQLSDIFSQAGHIKFVEQIGGRTVRVNFPEVPRGGERNMMAAKFRISNQSFVDTPHKIYAGNLGWSVTTEALRDAFADQLGFLSAKVVYGIETGRSRGFGFISFSSVEAAQSALSTMDGMELEGRPLRLNIAADRSRSNSGTEQGQVLSPINS